MKYKLLLFRNSIKEIPINNHHVHIYKMEKAYRNFFDVTVIDYPCDYNEVVERFHPDLTLFHIIDLSCNFLGIKNVKLNNSIPKVGMTIIDSGDASRGTLFRFMENVGIDTFFFSGVGLGEFFPEARDNFYYYPHFIDPDINYNYGFEKYIPVLLTGNFGSKFYDWRDKIVHPLMANFPTLYFRHPGYFTKSDIPDILRVHGEKYFKTLSASWIAPTCGSIKNTLVMKHLEIPGAGCCLVCEESNTVKLYGFKDLENCVFSQPYNIVDKIRYLFQNPHILDSITQNGYELVHSYHTFKQRPQILQWLELHKMMKNEQKIIQPTILGNLELINIYSEKDTILIRGANEVKLLTNIDDCIHEGKYSKATDGCINIINIAEYIHDAKLRLYIIHMLNKRKVYAFKIIKILIGFKMEFNLMPDPINMCFFILHLLSTKNLDKAVYYSCIGISRRRKELDYVRLLSFYLKDEKQLYNSLLGEILKPHNEKDYKTFYYFYSKKLDLLKVIKKIASKNIKGNRSKLLDNLKPFPSLIPISLNEIDKPFDALVLSKDLNVLDKEIKIRHKIEKKVQEFICKTRESKLKFNIYKNILPGE